MNPSWLLHHNQCMQDSTELSTDGETPKMCTGGSWSPMMIFSDVMFWLDIALSFRTGVIDSKQIIHMQPKFAALHYARTWLVVDAISSFPFEAIVLGALHREANSVGLVQHTSASPSSCFIHTAVRYIAMLRILYNMHLSRTFSR